MSDSESKVSRRGFLGGSISAAVAGLAGTTIPRTARAEPPCTIPSLDALKAPQNPDEAYWWKIRKQFNIDDSMTFMQNGTFGPPPRIVMDEHIKIQRELAMDPRDNYRSGQLRDNKEVLRRSLVPLPGRLPTYVARPRG